MFAEIQAAMAARKVLTAAIGAAVVFGAGFAAAEVYEHKVPWGLGPKRDAQAARADGYLREINKVPGGWRDLLQRMTDDRDGWREAEKRCGRLRIKERDARADAIATAGDEKAAAASGGFEQGYAAGRAVGLKQCGGARAQTDRSRPSGGPAGGVPDNETDFGAAFNRRAYSPGGPVRPGS